jgi:hypothetical protein
MVVVVAGDDHDLSLGAQRLRDPAQQRLGRTERAVKRPVAQLQRVAEQDQPIDVRERGQQRRLGTVAPEDIAARARPQVQVGDDERPQRRVMPRR